MLISYKYNNVKNGAPISANQLLKLFGINFGLVINKRVVYSLGVK